MIYHLTWHDGEDDWQYHKGSGVPALAEAYSAIYQECCDIFFKPPGCNLIMDIVMRRSKEDPEEYQRPDDHVRLMRDDLCVRDLSPDKQVEWGAALAHVKVMDIWCLCYQPIPIFWEKRKSRFLCEFKVNLSETAVMQGSFVTIQMSEDDEEYPMSEDEDFTDGSGDDEVRSRQVKPWVKGDPEYEFCMSAKDKLQTVLEQGEKPVRFSRTLFQRISETLEDVRRATPGLKNRRLFDH